MPIPDDIEWKLVYVGSAESDEGDQELDTVLVDVGTGYFIEKSIDEAQAFLTRKLGLIESQAQNVQGAAQFKNQNLSQTVDVMNRKIVEMRSGGGSSSGGGTAV